MDSVTLRADSLASKGGFEDGDILSKFGPPAVYEHDVLALLVRKHLLPLLPNWVEVYEIGTCHNPIRAEPGRSFDYCYNSDISVEITEGMYREAVGKVLK